MPRPSPNAAGALLALASFGIFATHDALIKSLAKTYSPIQIVFCIALFSFPLLLVMLARDKVSGTLLPIHPRLMMFRGVSVAVSALSAFYAFSVLPLAQAYAILFSTPLMITVLAIPLLGERVGLRRALAVAAGLCGVLIVLRPGSADLSLGHLAALTSATAGALNAIITRRIGRRERSAVMLLYAMGGNFVLMGLAMPFVYVPMPGPDISVMIVIAAMAFAAMQLIIMAYRRGEAVIVAPMQYSQILWATVYGALFFDELPTPTTLIGAGLVIASGVYILLRESNARTSEIRPVLGPDNGKPPTL